MISYFAYKMSKVGDELKFYRTKISMMKEALEEKEVELNKKSEVEEFVNKAKKANYLSKNLLNKIDSMKKCIKELEDEYETQVLKRACYKNQIERKIK